MRSKPVFIGCDGSLNAISFTLRSTHVALLTLSRRKCFHIVSLWMNVHKIFGTCKPWDKEQLDFRVMCILIWFPEYYFFFNLHCCWLSISTVIPNALLCTSLTLWTWTYSLVEEVCALMSALLVFCRMCLLRCLWTNRQYYTKRTSVPSSHHVAPQCTYSCEEPEWPSVDITYMLRMSGMLRLCNWYCCRLGCVDHTEHEVQLLLFYPALT